MKSFCGTVIGAAVMVGFGISGMGCGESSNSGPSAVVPNQRGSEVPFANHRDYWGGRNRTLFAQTQAIAASQRELSLCEIVRWQQGPAGLFRVDEIVGVTEDLPNGDADGFTYVELTLLEDWGTGSPSRPTLRIDGGPMKDSNIVKIWRVDLRKGENVGLVLGKPTAENKGFYTLHNLGVFSERPPRGVSNGQLFTTTRQTFAGLGGLVKQARAAGTGPCADVTSDYRDQARPLPESNADVQVHHPVRANSPRAASSPPPTPGERPPGPPPPPRKGSR